MLEALVLTHRLRWFNFVRKLVRNPEDAEDVIQEAVKRVLVRNRSFASVDELRMYLGRAISNTAIEFYHMRRREQRRACALRDDVPETRDGADPYRALESRERAAANEQLQRLVLRSLKCLPAREHEALRLTVMDSGAGSIREISSEIGIPYSTLRHRSVQGLRKLRVHVFRAIRDRAAARPAP